MWEFNRWTAAIIVVSGIFLGLVIKDTIAANRPTPQKKLKYKHQEQEEQEERSEVDSEASDFEVPEDGYEVGMDDMDDLPNDEQESQDEQGDAETGWHPLTFSDFYPFLLVNLGSNDWKKIKVCLEVLKAYSSYTTHQEKMREQGIIPILAGILQSSPHEELVLQVPNLTNLVNLITGSLCTF
jgi:hypothetical protein